MCLTSMVSPRGQPQRWNRRKKSNKNTLSGAHTHTPEYQCNQEAHQNQMLSLTNRSRQCRGRDAAVTAAPTDLSHSALVFRECVGGALRNTSWTWHGKHCQETGRGGRTQTHNNASPGVRCAFAFFSVFRYAHGHRFFPPHHFPLTILITGGFKTTLYGKLGERPLCIWLRFPLKTYRWF